MGGADGDPTGIEGWVISGGGHTLGTDGSGRRTG